jgi:hypothetical protein
MFTAEEQPLIDGSDSDVEEFVDCDHCMVIDWRSTVDEVLEDVPRWLPAASLRYEWLDSQHTQLKLIFAGREDGVTLRQERTDNWLIVYRISRLLRPDYELLLLVCTSVSDTAAFLIRSADWWAAYRTQYPERYRKHFGTLEQYAYLWSLPETEMPRSEQKPWWERLFQ